MDHYATLHCLLAPAVYSSNTANDGHISFPFNLRCTLISLDERKELRIHFIFPEVTTINILFNQPTNQVLKLSTTLSLSANFFYSKIYGLKLSQFDTIPSKISATFFFFFVLDYVVATVSLVPNVLGEREAIQSYLYHEQAEQNDANFGRKR